MYTTTLHARHAGAPRSGVLHVAPLVALHECVRWADTPRCCQQMLANELEQAENLFPNALCSSTARSSPIPEGATEYDW